MLYFSFANKEIFPPSNIRKTYCGQVSDWNWNHIARIFQPNGWQLDDDDSVL